jgi:hypothetical protein
VPAVQFDVVLKLQPRRDEVLTNKLGLFST